MLLVLAAVIGIAVGLVVTLFFRAIDVVQRLVLQEQLRMAALPADAIIIVVVGLGLALARLLVHYGARDSDGENVPDVMFRVSLRGGSIPLRPVLAKTLGAAIVIGTGGSVGAEGPVIVAGAATASRLGRWMRASPNRLRTLVGCGAAAGLSAAFNAPIAGMIFGIEKILGATAGLAIGPFVIASVLASAVGRAIFGNHPVMAAGGTDVLGAWQYVALVPLGVICGLVATLYTRLIWRAHDVLGAMRPWQRVIAGMAIVGLLDAMFRADLWGHGHEALNLGGLAGHGAAYLLALCVAKLLATAVTLAVAGLGGVFMPALYVGATLGAGLAAAAVLIGAPSSAVGAMALCGMAGVVSGATFAPLTAMMMVFEMTGHYTVILPLMVTSVLAYLVARRVYPESVYTEWLVRRGVVLTHGADAAVMARVAVSECMDAAPVAIPDRASLADIDGLTRGNPRNAWPVTAEDGRLIGMLSADALRVAREDPALGPLLVAADLAVPRDSVTRDDSLLTALRRLGASDEEYLPVVEPGDAHMLAGIVSRQNLFDAYERALALEGH